MIGAHKASGWTLGSEGDGAARLPLSLKIGYAIFVAVLVPVYWWHYGPVNFLWFSNIALLTTLVAVWRESALLVSMMALAVVFFEMFWIIGYFTRLITGTELLGLSAYMFDDSIPLFIRGLSLYHIVLPPLLLWLMYRLGYDRRALWRQTLVAWVVLPLCYLVGDPEGNENWVFGWGEHGERAILPGFWWVLAQMVAFPLLVYLPCDRLFRRWFGREKPGPAASPSPAAG